MKLCITMISNRPEMARKRWLASIDKLNPLQKKVGTYFTFIFEKPFSEDDAIPYLEFGYVELREKRHAKRFNWWPDRNEVIKMATADYYLMTDDDCRFGGTTPTGYSSWKRYYDAIRYMDRHPDCGAVCLLPFLGGTPFGEKIMVADRDMYALGAGLLLRRLPELDYSIEEFNRPGALDEPAAIFSRIERGYYCAKTYNTPTIRPPTKRVEPGANHPAYDDDFINNKGIGRVIRDRYDDPKWHINTRRIPKGCLESYFIHCKLRGIKPKHKEPK
jgi:hypothetical protein